MGHNGGFVAGEFVCKVILDTGPFRGQTFCFISLLNVTVGVSALEQVAGALQERQERAASVNACVCFGVERGSRVLQAQVWWYSLWVFLTTAPWKKPTLTKKGANEDFVSIQSQSVPSKPLMFNVRNCEKYPSLLPGAHKNMMQIVSVVTSTFYYHRKLSGILLKYYSSQ